MKTTEVLKISALSLVLAFIYQRVHSQHATLEVSAKQGIDFVLINPSGQLAGFDPLSDTEFQQIPEANYGYDGISDVNGPNGLESIWSTFYTASPSAGIYLLRTIGTISNGFNLGVTGRRNGTKYGTSIYAVAAPGRTMYFELSFDPNPSVPIVLTRVLPLPHVRGGIFNPSGSTLGVKARPSVNFNAGSTLVTLTATIRWLSSYGITLGEVNSPVYNFTKVDSLITIGGYQYQKFRTVTPLALNWTANSEYELFTVGVSGGTGTGMFELTNEIPGGEWFVDINYSDRSDTSFYQRSVSSVPLPIQLAFFRAYPLFNNNVFTEWMTISETNNYGFEMQRSPNAPNNFQTIPNSFVPGHGSTLEPHYYSWLHVNPGSGLWYYRLKQIDLDGTVHYADPVAVNIGVGQGETELESFAASSTGNGNVDVEWATRRERNTRNFVLMASRNDSLHFATIPLSSVRGQGNSNARKTYKFKDRRQQTGVWYYRLKVYDTEGNVRQSYAIRADVR